MVMHPKNKELPRYMKKEYLASLIALLLLVTVQITTVWLMDTGLGVRLFLVGLTVIMLMALIFLAREAWRRYQKLTAAIRQSRELYNAVHELTEQNNVLTKEISELGRAKESLIRQQTKIFDLLQAKNK